jgi:hypothetical protein
MTTLLKVGRKTRRVAHSEYSLWTPNPSCYMQVYITADATSWRPLHHRPSYPRSHLRLVIFHTFCGEVSSGTPVGYWDNTEDDNLAKSRKKTRRVMFYFTILQAQYQNLAGHDLENTERHYAHASQPRPAQSQPCS